jgi:hypothetical protein
VSKEGVDRSELRIGCRCVSEDVKWDCRQDPGIFIGAGRLVGP